MGVTPRATGLVVSCPFPHALTHKTTDPTCDSCIRGKMRNLRTYVGAFSRPVKEFGGVVTMDLCSFYDHGMKYSLNGDTVALVVRDMATTFGCASPAQSKTTEVTVVALQMFIENSGAEILLRQCRRAYDRG